MSNFDAQLLRAVTIYQLDSCGRIPASGNVVLRGMADGAKNIAWTRVVDAGTPTTERTVNGFTCPPPPSIAIDSGYDVTITGCGQNKVFESMIGYTKLLLTAGNITGFTASRFKANQKVAIELIFEPYGDDACAGAGNDVMAVLIPSVTQWTVANAQTFNGMDRSDAAWTGRTFVNRRLFDNFSAAPTKTPSELAHWQPYLAEIESGDDWMVSTYMAAPSLQTGTANVLSALVP